MYVQLYTVWCTSDGLGMSSPKSNVRAQREEYSEQRDPAADVRYHRQRHLVTIAPTSRRPVDILRPAAISLLKLHWAACAYYANLAHHGLSKQFDW